MRVGSGYYNSITCLNIGDTLSVSLTLSLSLWRSLALPLSVSLLMEAMFEFVAHCLQEQGQPSRSIIVHHADLWYHHSS